MSTSRRILRTLAWAAPALLIVTSVGFGSGPARAEEQPPYHPSRLAHVGDSGQVIVVTAPRWRTSYGTLRAYERDGEGGWRLVVDATPARLGWTRTSC